MRKVTTFILLFVFFSAISPFLNAQNTDIELLRTIHNSSSGLRTYSEFMSGTTKIVSVSVPVVMATAAFIQKDDDLLKDAIYVGASMGVNTVITYALKYSVNRERPYLTYPDLNVPASLYESSASFPSGHTSLAFSTATALSIKHPKWYVIAPAYLWAGSVGYSRMHLGVHYPSDVLAGALLGAGSAWITYKANEWFWRTREKKTIIWY